MNIDCILVYKCLPEQRGMFQEYLIHVLRRLWAFLEGLVRGGA